MYTRDNISLKLVELWEIKLTSQYTNEQMSLICKINDKE